MLQAKQQKNTDIHGILPRDFIERSEIQVFPSHPPLRQYEMILFFFKMPQPHSVAFILILSLKLQLAVASLKT